MKLGVFFESQSSSGGGFYLSQTKLEALIKSIDSKKEIICFVTNKDTKDSLKKKFTNIKIEIFQVNIFRKFLLFLYTVSFIKKILYKMKLRNPFENKLINNDIELLFFLSPSSFVRFCEKINFVYNIWEVQHRSIPYFPEYSDKKYSQSTYELREESYEFAVKRAFKIIVDTEKSAQDIIKNYNCSRDNLFEVQPFVPSLPKYYERVKEKLNFKEIFSKLNLPNKKILFYPAQFWPHKNHIYLVDSFKNLLKNNIDEYILVFTGRDRGNKEYILKTIEKNNLKNEIIIFDFLKLEEIIALYKYSFALIMTTLVGRSSLPLREAFYFELPVFYSKDLLDKSYSKFVNELDLNDPSSLSNYLKSGNYNQNLELIKSAKEFYLETCSDKAIIKSNKNVIKEYENYSKYWQERNL